MSEALLQVQGLSKSFRARGAGVFRRPVRAVSDVSFTLRRGETLGLVGESGCGKSTLARLVLHLIEPDSGHVLIDGAAFTRARDRCATKTAPALADRVPGRPFVAQSAHDGRRQHRRTDAAARPRRRPPTDADAARELLQLVGLNAQDEDRYPHEFSGGQCQRIAIARALILRPDIIVFDEAVSALDVSIRAQILRLILDLQQRLGLSYIFISHDLGVVKRVADRIAVMYLGRMVEIGPADDVVRRPLHPYAEALLRAIPIADPRRMRVRDLGLVEGEVTSQIGPSAGCAFHPRCTRRLPLCAVEVPATTQIEPDHSAACFLHTSAIASA